ncbi:MAG: nuclease-related domain-containing protein [Pseudomonadota bacterium]
MLKRWAALTDTPEKAGARVSAVLSASGLPYIRDVVVPDQIGGYTEIPHLLLTPDGILVLESQYFTGIVHSSAFTKNWTRFEGDQRHVFGNPLHRQRELADTLDKMIQGERVGVGVETRFVITGPVRFAKEIPGGILSEAQLQSFLATRARQIPARQRAVWEVLLSRVACEPVAPFGTRGEVSVHPQSA